MFLPYGLTKKQKSDIMEKANNKALYVFSFDLLSYNFFDGSEREKHEVDSVNRREVVAG